MGHLFITRADLRDFECDDFLIPTDRYAKVEPSWWDGRRDDALRAAGAVKPGEQLAVEVFPNGGDRYRPIDVTGLPRAWLGRTAAKSPDIPWYVSGAEGFVDAVMRSPRREPRNRRAKRLVALPLVGSRKGGGYAEAGSILASMLPALYRKADEYGIDIALVLREDDAFAAAEAVRRKLAARADRWPELAPEEKRAAERLAGIAAAGDLVLFFGAGLGVPSGLPVWRELLEALIAKARIVGEEAESLRGWSNLDQAQYVERALLERASLKLGDEIVSMLRGRESINLSASYLANLPVEGYITTNYDRIFERASAAAGRPVAILPYAPRKDTKRWLLKMHGCVDHPEDIVLTRRSYNRYAERNQALAGIVQAMLITKEMLFVGFSLGDDNFLRIVDAVRQAVQPLEHGNDPRSAPPFRLGTALLLERNPVLERHWSSELDIVSLGAERGDLAEASRKLEIFLDYLTFRTASAAYLLEPRFREMLDGDELAVVDELQRLEAAARAVEDPCLRAMLEGMIGRFQAGGGTR